MLHRFRSFRVVAASAAPLLSAAYLLCSLAFVPVASAEKPKAEDLVDQTVAPEEAVDLNNLRRGRLTEEQAIDQLEYMMVKGWARIEKELLDRGSFQAFGMVLSPQGEFRTVTIKEQDALAPDMQLGVIVKNLEAIAQTRSMWAVGLMYIQGKERSDGTVDKRIMVLGEHIAGWARHWAYPFKVEDGQVMLARPTETDVQPVYYVQ